MDDTPEGYSTKIVSSSFPCILRLGWQRCNEQG